MWNVVKMLVVALGVGGLGGVLAKGRIDAALKGEAPKKVKKPKIQIVELPADVEVDNIVVQTKAKAGSKTLTKGKRRELPPEETEDEAQTIEVEGE